MKPLDPKIDLPSPAIILAILMRIVMYPKCSRKCYRDIDDFCWLFVQGDSITDGRDGCRYPSITFNGATWMAHRAMWEFLHQRKIPEDLVLRHKCDRPRCVNPFHLETGSVGDNVRDFNRRVRNAAKGEANGAYTHPEKRPRGERVVDLEVSEDIARLIMGSLEILGTDLDAIVAIAGHYSTPPYVVQQAAAGETWRNVEPIVPKVLPKIRKIDLDIS